MATSSKTMSDEERATLEEEECDCSAHSYLGRECTCICVHKEGRVS